MLQHIGVSENMVHFTPQYLMVSHTLISLWLQVRGYKSLSDAYMLSVGMGQQYLPQWMGSIILAGGSRRSRGASSVCRVFVAKNGAGAGRARGSDWNKMLFFFLKKWIPQYPWLSKPLSWSNDWRIGPMIGWFGILALGNGNMFKLEFPGGGLLSAQARLRQRRVAAKLPDAR